MSDDLTGTKACAICGDPIRKDEFGFYERYCDTCRNLFAGYTESEAKYIRRHEREYQFVNGRIIKIHEDEIPAKQTIGAIPNTGTKQIPSKSKRTSKKHPTCDFHFLPPFSVSTDGLFVLDRLGYVVAQFQKNEFIGTNPAAHAIANAINECFG